MFRALYLILIALVVIPIVPGIIGVMLSSFSYIPPLGLYDFSLSGYLQAIHWPGLPKSATLTLLSSLISTYLALLLTFIILQSFWSSKIWRFVENLLSPLLAIPHVAFAIGFAFLFSPTGISTRIIGALANIELNNFSATWFVQDPYALGLTIALAIKELPFLLLMSIPILNQLNIGRMKKVSNSLGYSTNEFWWKVVLPQWLNKMRFPLFAVIAYGASVVDFALVLGPTTPPTLAVLTWQWFSEPDLTLLPRAAAGAMILFSLTAALLATVFGIEKFSVGYCSTWQYSGRFGFGLPGRTVLATTILINLMLIPIMVIWSLAQRWQYPDLIPSRFSLRYWATEWDNFVPTVTHSLLIAITSATFALLLAVLAHEYRVKNRLHLPGALIALPILIPQLSILFGIQIVTLYISSDSYYLWVVWSHVFFAFPFVYLSLDGPWRSYDNNYTKAALSLGKPPLHVFLTVKAKLLLQPICYAWAIGASVSLAQYLPTLILGGGRIATITTEAVALSSGFDRRVTAIYALWQALLPFVFFSLAIVLPRILNIKASRRLPIKEPLTNDASSRKPRHL